MLYSCWSCFHGVLYGTADMNVSAGLVLTLHVTLSDERAKTLKRMLEPKWFLSKWLQLEAYTSYVYMSSSSTPHISTGKIYEFVS